MKKRTLFLLPLIIMAEFLYSCSNSAKDKNTRGLLYCRQIEDAEKKFEELDTVRVFDTEYLIIDKDMKVAVEDYGNSGNMQIDLEYILQKYNREAVLIYRAERFLEQNDENVDLNYWDGFVINTCISGLAIAINMCFLI